MRRLFSIFGIALIVVGCSSSPKTTNTVTTWEPSAPIVLTMSGDRTQNYHSEKFTITKSPFTVVWEFHSEDAYRKGAMFYVMANNTDTGEKHQIANIMYLSFSNRVEIDDTGTFYLSVSNGEGNFSITVYGE